MHKVLSLLCLVSIVFISSCGFQEKHEALEFYTKISGINDSLDKLTTEWHNARDQASVSKNYTGLNPLRINLGAFIARNRSSVADMPVTPSTEKIKYQEDSLLTTQTALVSDVYPKFEQFNEFTPKEEMDKAIMQMSDDVMNMRSKIASIQKLLQAYSDKYKLKK